MTGHAVVAQSRTELLMTLRRGESLVVTFAIPLGVLVFFSKFDTTLPAGYSKAVDFLVPGVLALSVMSSAMVSLGISTGFERRYGVLKRLGTTPLSRGALLSAKTATILVMEAIQLVLVLAVGAALGWSPPSVGKVALAIPLLILGSIAFAGLGLLMAGTLRAEATLALANALFLVLLFLGGMAYPLERLPAFMRDVAHALPAAALAECLRGVLVAHHSLPTGSLAVLCVWALALPLAAARWFRWEE